MKIGCVYIYIYIFSGRSAAGGWAGLSGHLFMFSVFTGKLTSLVPFSFVAPSHQPDAIEMELLPKFCPPLFGREKIASPSFVISDPFQLFSRFPSLYFSNHGCDSCSE